MFFYVLNDNSYNKYNSLASVNVWMFLQHLGFSHESTKAPNWPGLRYYEIFFGRCHFDLICVIT